MTAFPSLSNFFPSRYRREAWAPAVLAAGAFICLEAAFHARHEVTRHVMEDPLEFVWEVFYIVGCLSYLAPLALPALREEVGFLRRAFVGFSLQLLLGGAWLWLGPEGVRLEPCLSVANAVFIAAMLSRKLAWVRESSAVAAVSALALATLASNRHDALDVAVGASVGWAAYLLSSSSALDVLASEDLVRSVRFHLSNITQLFGAGRSGFWDSTYRSGDWAFLEGGNQRLRHFAIAGIIRERFPAGAMVLDVGCGYGTLRRSLGEGGSYTGLDVSSEAIRLAQSAEPSSGAKFVRGDFLETPLEERFDAVVLNEMLYYLPTERIREAAGKAGAAGEIVVVSMHRNPKVAAAWRALDSCAPASLEMEIRDPDGGSSWLVRLYEGRRLADGAAAEHHVSLPDLRREQAVTSLALAASLTAGFYYIDRAAAARAVAGAPFWAPASALDAGIPFLAGWVWAYLLYFPLCFAPLALHPVRSEPEVFRGAARGFLIQFCAAFAVFLLWPSGVPLPQLSGGGLSESTLGLIHRFDPGFNVFPSLHAANTVFVACLVGRFAGGLPSAAAWIAAGLVCVSTVFVKQHYLADVPAGAALGALAFAASFGPLRATGAATALRPFLRFGFAAAFAPIAALMGFLAGAPAWGLFGFGAALSSCSVARLLGAVGGWGAFFAATAVGLLAPPESFAAFSAGAGLGGFAYWLAFWDQMLFLDDVEPFRRLRHQVDEALNVFLGSDKSRWNRMYAAGQWEHLHGDEIAPLYESIGAQLRKAIPGGGRVVDLGCGNGALIPFLRGWHRGYSGVDLSEVAVSQARSRGLRADESVGVSPVEDYVDFSGHEAAVFNEVLYYLPVREAVAAVRRASTALGGPKVVLVVMTDNPKARAVWAELDRWRSPVERRVFRITPNDPPCESRLYVETDRNA